MKNCTRCGQIKDVGEFAADKQKKDGLRNWCRACVREHRQINAESVKASRARYNEANRESQRQASREYHHANRDSILERKREYDAQNRDQTAARVAAYYDQYPEKKWINSYQNRARTYGLEPFVEDFTRQDVIAAYGDSCNYCESGAFEELDHYRPIAAGGAHSLVNVRPSCAACNNTKSQSDRLAVEAFRLAHPKPTDPNCPKHGETHHVQSNISAAAT